MPHSSVLYSLPEFAQIYVHSVGDTITISSSGTTFSFCVQSLTASGSFPMSKVLCQGPKFGASASAVLPMTILGRFPFRID